MKNTFRGGVHPEGHKDLARESRLRLFDPKGEMVFPLSMHIGKPAKPVVKKNDEVKVGQLLAEADGFISAPIHSSCSGTVKAIEKRRVLGGGMAECIVISNDGQFTPFADYTQRTDAAQLSNQDIIRRVKEAGVVGLGGAGFPTAVKLMPKDPDAIEYVIANGAECEPYLTCNDQLMRIHSNEIVEGMELVLRLFPNPITKEEALAICQRAEENGYVHQTTNIDGSDKIFGLCNCDVGVCFALRTSQYFNTPNLSASAYRAHVNKENCVACGKCVEVCPAGAVKLGQKLCTKQGEVKYPQQPLPTLKWGEKDYNPNYVFDNRKNCHESGTAPCKTACPAHIAIQGYIKLAKEGRYLDALKLIKQDNPFPSVCGYVCNRRCEDACTRGAIDKALAIDEIKKFIAEQDLKSEERDVPTPLYRRPIDKPYEEKVAIIGAGPAGMSCAYYLARMGYTNVTVFDRNREPGGMLVMGIPSYRLDRSALKGEIEVLEKMGVHFQMNTEVGRDVTIQQLREQGYKGFYVAIGAQKSSKLRIPGEELQGVFGGVDFLREVNLGEKPELGKKCAVIGGGNVAMDVCRTAVRLGAETYVVYRRGEDEMPADKEEVAEAKAEGVKFCFLNAPVEILGEDGRVKGLKVELMELGEPDEKGRRAPVGTGRFEVIEVDSVIAAVGQSIDWGTLDIGALKTGKKGNAVADPITYQTAQDDIFVGGDVYTGPKFAIDAIAAGREGAESLHRFVQEGQSLTISRNLREFYELDKDNIVLGVDSFDRPARQEIRHDPAKARSFEHDRLTFTEEQVKAEASRCLGCGVSVVDPNKCIGCGLCTTRCMFDAIHLERDVPEASNMVRCEDKVGPMLKYAGKQAIKIIRKG